MIGPSAEDAVRHHLRLVWPTAKRQPSGSSFYAEFLILAGKKM